MQVIIYQQGSGVAVVIPAPNSGLTINEVAAKDVPEGASWRVVDDSSLPSYDSRDRWEWTESGSLTVAAAPSPAEITKVQFVRAMRQLDLWDSYKATVEADADWPYITQMPRDNATLNASANAVLGEQTAQALLDQVFTLGATL